MYTKVPTHAGKQKNKNKKQHAVDANNTCTSQQARQYCCRYKTNLVLYLFWVYLRHLPPHVGPEVVDAGLLALDLRLLQLQLLHWRLAGRCWCRG